MEFVHTAAKKEPIVIPVGGKSTPTFPKEGGGKSPLGGSMTYGA
jgi:hypothetical protein